MKKILVVEDDESLLQVLKHVLLREGYPIEVSLNAQDALRKISAEAFDLVVLDLMLPGGNGYDILREIQQMGRPETGVVIITGKLLAANTEEMLRRESNVVEFLRKPLNYPRLVSVINKALKSDPKKPS